MRSCALGCLLAFPARMIIIILVIFTDIIGRGFQGSFWIPFLGFFFAPITTIAYAVAMINSNFALQGPWLLLVGVALAADLAVAIDGGRRARRGRIHFDTVARGPRRDSGDAGRQNVRVRGR
jgi:hypothetical protein